MPASSIRCEFDLDFDHPLKRFSLKMRSADLFYFDLTFVVQDDAYIDSYISTIGVDFVSSTK